MVDPPAEPDRAGRPTRCARTSPARSTTRPSRATCACPRRRRSASRSCSTTSRRRARRATSSWRASSSRRAAAARQAAAASGAMSATKRQALGRGLAALIPGAPAPVPSLARRRRRSRRRRAASAPATGLRTVAIEEVHPSREQPRKTFDDARLDELAASIRAQGMIQPLVVRLRASGGYELIAGERRWRAAQRAGLHEVPVVVRDVAPTRGLRDGAGREPAARGPRTRSRRPTGYQRLIERARLHPGGAGRRAWARIARRSPTRCACCGCPMACATW